MANPPEHPDQQASRVRTLTGHITGPHVDAIRKHVISAYAGFHKVIIGKVPDERRRNWLLTETGDVLERLAERLVNELK